MYRKVILEFVIILALVSISVPALGQSNFALSGVVDDRGMIPIGSGKVPYARFVLEQVGIYSVDDPTHLHLNLIGADFPVLHKPVGPLLGIELSGLFGPLWELKTWTLNFRQVVTIGLRLKEYDWVRAFLDRELRRFMNSCSGDNATESS